MPAIRVIFEYQISSNLLESGTGRQPAQGLYYDFLYRNARGRFGELAGEHAIALQTSVRNLKYEKAARELAMQV